MNTETLIGGIERWANRRGARASEKQSLTTDGTDKDEKQRVVANFQASYCFSAVPSTLREAVVLGAPAEEVLGGALSSSAE